MRGDTWRPFLSSEIPSSAGPAPLLSSPITSPSLLLLVQSSLVPTPSPSPSGRRNYDPATMSNGNLETRTLFDELKSLEKGWLFDFGHPLVNRVAESFVKAAGIGAIQAVSREAYFTASEAGGADSASVPELPSSRRHRFPGLRGESSKKSLEEMVSLGKLCYQWLFLAGLAAGMYSGLTYGLREARGSHDWKNSAVAGAITGAALALTAEDATHEHIVQCAITGAAISTAANLLSGVF
ncbi:LOW QUALITY PROTEIN: outer envelope pore protein 16-2, chloroplastic [Asparagus officinalis]|uniref:LOW QUALITY PROTEIN: outer envelope pore protein 16-2, chloroplastic n=1 Tax=Asparagus officinalis TaxID=4686 RepID=UPI00098E3D4D|nr:LOW QUALITY PROTEIN: outer envelope pore protein 16-2, chloroplastic [Asparagus officinalis]